MTVAIMQPYIFPYLGYYQLVNAVDTFVFFDDVNYINKGWINHNNILQKDKSLKFTVPLVKASQNKLINEIEISEYDKWRKGFLKSVEINYKKAPQFSFIFNWLNEFFAKEFVLISDLASDSVKEIARLLELSVIFENSSSINYKTDVVQKGEQKILKLCKILKTDKYINPKNGVSLYNKDLFNLENIELKFIDMHEMTYQQFRKNKFVPYLSILDIMMFNSKSEIVKMLDKYDLI